ncbi:hypothetical protein DL770_009735 [Monosporascus sp. CRB-9-2]|nr:hypothetical protein DL770_009735 [Monosporascus sp. CRB-9-2]
MADLVPRHDAPVFVDGRLAKLRASCDSCNESKGAPRIGDSQGAPRLPSPPACKTSSSQLPLPSDRLNTNATACMVAERGADTNHETAAEAQTPQQPFNDVVSTPLDDSLLTSLDFPDDFDIYTQEPTDSHNISTSLDLGLYTPNTLASSRVFDPPMPFFDQISQATTVYEGFSNVPATDTPASRSQVCSCSSRVIQQICAVKLSEDSIECECTLGDEMNIGTFIGRILQGFDETLNASPATAKSAHGDTPNGMAPKLSWGVLELEEDDESGLRQHLWLMQFGKLEKLLNRFSTSVRRLRNSHGSGNSAHVMLCECIHMWLEQKAQVIKDRCLKKGLIGAGRHVDARKSSLSNV